MSQSRHFYISHNLNRLSLYMNIDPYTSSIREWNNIEIYQIMPVQFRGLLSQLGMHAHITYSDPLCNKIGFK